jgi:diacylglycerol kinase family enzyme
MRVRQMEASGALVLGAGSVAAAAFTVVNRFPGGILPALFLAAAASVAYEAVLRRGRMRLMLDAIVALLLAGAVVRVVEEQLLGGFLLVIGLLAAGLVLAQRAFRVRTDLAEVDPPKHPIMVWNPHSGGGKTLRLHLDQEARARGIAPIQLRLGDDLAGLVEAAVAAGADGLAAAGGDGTQAVVAAIAAAHDLPFACIPAGTRNHFALDLGVDRADVVGALDAFVRGRERCVDLAEINGRTFVNNVSLGLYGEAVQKPGYRDSKLRTILDTARHDLVEGQEGTSELRWKDPSDEEHVGADVILVSNNSYRLGRLLGSGTRPCLNAGRLGVAVMALPASASPGRAPEARAWYRWQTPRFTVDSVTDVRAGVDGEAVKLRAPLEFRSRPAALRVRIAPHHPGASPSARTPERLFEGVRMLVSIARGE